MNSGGSCTVDLSDGSTTSSPPPDQGAVVVSAIGSCTNGMTLAVGQSCFATGFPWQSPSAYCSPDQGYAAGWGSADWLVVTSVPSTGVFSSPGISLVNTNNLVTRIGPGTITIHARQEWITYPGNVYQGHKSCFQSVSSQLIGTETLN